MKKWTPAEEELLKKLVAEGKTSVDIGEQLGRTVKAIVHKKTCLKVRSVPKISPFNPHDVAGVIKFKMIGWTHRQIAAVYDVHFSEITRILGKYGLKGKGRFFVKTERPPRLDWTEVDTAYLRKLLKRGLPRTHIYAKFPNRSEHAVERKIRRLTQYWLSPSELLEREALKVDWKVKYERRIKGISQPHRGYAEED